MKQKLPIVYIGYDSREDLAYRVARDSISRRCAGPLKVIPLRLKNLGMLTRPVEWREGQLWCPVSKAPMSTEFAISRFCVPFLQDEGWALFADCDILCWTDINELFALADDKYAVMVVKHNSEMQGGETKMDGQIQTYYSRKNWSSVVLWNCEHPANKGLTEIRLNQWPGRDLHAFKWLKDDEIGELPQHWNWLVNVTPGDPEKRGIWHYTLGTPELAGCEDLPHADDWKEECELTVRSAAYAI